MALLFKVISKEAGNHPSLWEAEEDNTIKCLKENYVFMVCKNLVIFRIEPTRPKLFYQLSSINRYHKYPVQLPTALIFNLDLCDFIHNVL